MSLFQHKADVAGGESIAESVPLHQFGCDAIFSRYDGGQIVGPVINITRARNLLVTGAAILECNGNTQTLRAGDWFELPARKEYTLRYLSVSLVIEFWFDHRH